MKQTIRGRILAGLMSLFMVIGLLPIIGGTALVNAATSFANQESIMNLINARMNKANTSKHFQTLYVHQMWRARVQRTSLPDDEKMLSYTSPSDNKTYPSYTSQFGNYYYRNNKNNPNNPEAKGAGICTWCAYANLLNRKIALLSSSADRDANGKMLIEKLFTMQDVVPALSGVTGIYYENYDTLSSQNFIYIGSNNGYSNGYNHTLSKGNYTITTASQNISSLSTHEKKTKIAELIADHPEGVVVQFGRNGNNHGFVITGYDEANNQWYALDTGSSSRYSADKNWKIEDCWIGQSPSYGNKDNDRSLIADKIFDGISSVVYITSSNGGSNPPDNTSALKISNLSIDGKAEPATLTQGKSANLMGTVSSDANITSIRAEIIDILDTVVYDQSIAPNVKSVNLKTSALNQTVGTQKIFIRFGTLVPGWYELKITAKDAKGRTATESISFAVKGINIDLSEFKSYLTYGKSYSIPGKITSNEWILEVKARVVSAASGQYNATAIYSSGAKKGQPVEAVATLVGWGYPLKGSKIDKEISMGCIAKGNYYFEVTVKTTNGMTKTVKKAFTIK